ncbi:hypothetical protein EJ419_01945 [Alloscardovia theropitheci]|uniref:MmcQ/YjbR family DNA-binding protein n=1 Tax=Alloscardovia theropitheci TaxID=2496842 RepID=A0A4R0QT82_9BIFI|nr:MmcQ/YjbR family DNA-binding protein [Alloscardovia theropitheci]TCD54718.1 hypothetical protein EJ419_01945 [Alloscardovia theropitheci]
MYNAETLKRYVREYFECEIDYPWISHPSFAVLRHEYSRTWFDLVMTLPFATLGASDSTDLVDAVNLKANPLDVDFFASQPGFVPAYHMNKTHWITVLLDGSVPDKQIEDMVEQSFELTMKASDK